MIDYFNSVFWTNIKIDIYFLKISFQVDIDLDLAKEGLCNFKCSILEQSVL